MNLSSSLILLLLSSTAQGKKEKTIELSSETVHWGYFSKTLEPVLTVDSGEKVTVEVSSLIWINGINTFLQLSTDLTLFVNNHLLFL